jgi:hypothetical protein
MRREREIVRILRSKGGIQTGQRFVHKGNPEPSKMRGANRLELRPIQKYPDSREKQECIWLVVLATVSWLLTTAFQPKSCAGKSLGGLEQ